MRNKIADTEPIVLRAARAIARYIGFGDELPAEPALTSQPFRTTAINQPSRLIEPTPQPALRLMSPSEPFKQHSGHKWRRHPQLRGYESPLPEDVREGRHAAVRGLFAARAGALEVATDHFSRAALCHEVDITAVPGFWSLTRGQMQTAVAAYEAAGRYRDAAALDAHIATIFRPSLVGATLQPVIPARSGNKVANN